jgi:hypothetical protein
MHHWQIERWSQKMSKIVTTMILRRLIPLLLILFLVSGCKKAAKIYLVPIGAAPMAEINDLASHYREKFGIQAEVLPAINPGFRDLDHERKSADRRKSGPDHARCLLGLPDK